MMLLPPWTFCVSVCVCNAGSITGESRGHNMEDQLKVVDGVGIRELLCCHSRFQPPRLIEFDQTWETKVFWASFFFVFFLPFLLFLLQDNVTR